MSYEFSTPVMNWEARTYPPTWKIVAFYVLGLAATLVMLYLYAAMLPQYIGFKATVLVGICLTAMGVLD